jgi:formylglycine-generating enzyme required for sulfatase activity
MSPRTTHGYETARPEWERSTNIPSQLNRKDYQAAPIPARPEPIELARMTPARNPGEIIPTTYYAVSDIGQPMATNPRVSRRMKLWILVSILSVAILVTVLLIWVYRPQTIGPTAGAGNQAQPVAQTNIPGPSETKSNVKPDTSNPVISAKPISIDLGKGVRMEFVPIRAGSFQMGSTSGNPDEQPVHRVTISRSFYLGKYEVTQAQWQSLMVDNPSVFGKSCGPECPVDGVDWDDAQQFIRLFNAKFSQYTFRLPTEAEWEYAARAGTGVDYASELNAVAWYKGNSSLLHPVGQKKPNAWGLYDMLGNVWEWCQDRYDEKYYKNSPLTDPQGPNAGESRVARGGSVLVDYCGPEVRTNAPPDKHASDVGFRVLLVSPNSQ